MNKDDARSILEPYHRELWEIWHTAWKRWLKLPDRAVLNHDRVRANIVWAFAIDEATSRFDETEEIRINDAHATKTFEIEDKLLFRFKKMDQKGISRNYPTQRAIFFSNQLELPGIPYGLGRVDIGYVLNDIKTSIVEILVSYRAGAWKYEILPPATATVVPLIPKASLSRSPLSRVRPRKREDVPRGAEMST